MSIPSSEELFVVDVNFFKVEIILILIDYLQL